MPTISPLGVLLDFTLSRSIPTLLTLLKSIYICILNLAIFYRKFSALLFQTLDRELLLPQRAQGLPQLLIFLYLTLSPFTTIIPTPTLLAPVLIPSDTAQTASPGKTEENRKQRNHQCQEDLSGQWLIRFPKDYHFIGPENLFNLL